MEDRTDYLRLAPCLGIGCARRSICARHCTETEAIDLLSHGTTPWVGYPLGAMNYCPGFIEHARVDADRQPAPRTNDRPAVWDLVIADMQARDQVGQRRYGTRLQPYNGRDALQDAYEEALDLVVYLRQVIEERPHGQ